MNAIREIYQLSAVLTGDFRRVEDEIRQLDQALRVQMIQSDATRGDILSALLEKEEVMAQTDAGRAFEGFFRLLCDPDRSVEFREQLQSILHRPAAQHLSARETHFLGRLVRELTRESERVFRVRRRTEESLRAFIETGAHLEHRAVDRLLGRLERLAVTFKETSLNFRKPVRLRLSTGRARIQSPARLRLSAPEERLDTRHVRAEVNQASLSSGVLDS